MPRFTWLLKSFCPAAFLNTQKLFRVILRDAQSFAIHETQIILSGSQALVPPLFGTISKPAGNLLNADTVEIEKT